VEIDLKEPTYAAALEAVLEETTWVSIKAHS
jgi:hypothetical protein